MSESSNVLDLATHLSFYDTLKEVEGKESNSQLLLIIQKYISNANDDSTTAWCSIILMYCLENWFNIKGANPSARSWLNVGTKTNNPTPKNSIVVLWRVSPSSWQGHVGIYMGEDSKNKDRILIFGGNQKNSINITSYPKSEVLGYVNLTPLDK